MNTTFSAYLESLGECASTPLVVGTQALITFSFDAEQVQLKGDMDAWKEGISMHRRKNLWWAIVDIDPTVSFSYKFLVDDEWYCDPHNPYISFGPEAENSCIPAPSKGGVVPIRDVYSPQLENHRTIYVYVPSAARQGSSCPVLYAQDGYNVFSNPMAPFGHWSMDDTLDALISEGLVPPILVVAIESCNRMNEYSWASFVHDVEVVPMLEAYAGFLMNTIEPIITNRWRCTDDRGILGGSLGGSSAFWMAWRFPHFFSRVASFSGSFWMEHPSMMELVEQSKTKPNLRMYLDAGDTSGEGEMKWEADNLSVVSQLHDMLCECGYLSASPTDISLHKGSLREWSENSMIPMENVCMVVGRGHRHREEDWAKRLRWALQFLYDDLERSMSIRIQE